MIHLLSILDAVLADCQKHATMNKKLQMCKNVTTLLSTYLLHHLTVGVSLSNNLHIEPLPQF